MIVNNGSTITVTNATPLTITSDSTVEPLAGIDGTGTIDGAFVLLNLGTISSDAPGGLLSINTATLTNQGTIFANGQSLVIQASVATTNLSGTTLTGGVWEAAGTGTLAINAAQILTDNATITLIGASSQILSGGTPRTIDNSLTTVGTAGVLNLLSGRNFQASTSLIVAGSVTLDGGTLSAPTSGLTVAATGAVSGFGTIDPGSPVVDGGLIEAKGGTLTLPGPSSLSGTGVLQVDAGSSLVLQAFGSYAQSLINNGTIDAAFAGVSGALTISTLYSGTGGFLVQGGTASSDRVILELPSGLSTNVAFDPNFGGLLLDAGATFNGTLTGFGDNDTIALAGIANAQTAVLAGNVLNVKDAGGGILQALTLNTVSTNYSGATFTVFENFASTQATVHVSGALAAACYAAGTLIRTRDGDVPIEQISAGDIVLAHFAGTTPVVWIGHRHVNCRRHPAPSQVWPVRIHAHAFGPRMPTRDLLLSPDHSVFVDDVLIPIKYLINGKTILQEKVETITYYHIELAQHDAVLAEGMTAESYLENGDRYAFDNGGEPVPLHPVFGVGRLEAFGCAPLVVAGEKLASVQARIRARIPRRRYGQRAA